MPMRRAWANDNSPLERADLHREPHLLALATPLNAFAAYGT